MKILEVCNGDIFVLKIAIMLVQCVQLCNRCTVVLNHQFKTQGRNRRGWISQVGQSKFKYTNTSEGCMDLWYEKGNAVFFKLIIFSSEINDDCGKEERLSMQ